MPEQKDLKAGDACPNCGGKLALNRAQHPDTLIDHQKRTSDRPDLAARYAEQVKAKADEFGLIHTCAGCGYSARLKAPAPAARAA